MPVTDDTVPVVDSAALGVAVSDPPDLPPPADMPAPEAFVHAIAIAAHQHAAAVPEDAPAADPVQARLPLPRPPFDLTAAWRELKTKRAEVRALGIEYYNAESRLKTAKADCAKKLAAFEEKRGELLALQDHYEDLEREATDPEPEQPDLNLHGGRECSWERDHPGEVCAICAAEREQHVTADEAQALHEATDASALVDEPPADAPNGLGVVVRAFGDTEGNAGFDVVPLYFAQDATAIAGWRWTPDATEAWVFVDEEEAYHAMEARQVAPDGYEFVSAALPEPPARLSIEEVEAKLDAALPDALLEEPPAHDGDNPTRDEPPAELAPEEPEPDPTIVVGSIAIATRKTGVCEVGERGVCYEVYELKDDRGQPYTGYSFLFEKGRADGFSPLEVRMFLNITGEVCEVLRDYEFKNAVALMRDFRKGIFRPALTGPEGGQP
jgi:hypothetical protein